MGLRDHFRYIKTTDLPEIRILNASICDFKYIKHSHDDYAIGITTKGYQSFFCDGSYYKVPKGGIMLFNPEEVHDGYSQYEDGYSYYMIYIPRSFFMNIVKEIFDKKIRDFSFQKTVVFDDLLRYKLTSLVTAVNNKENNSFLVNELFVAMVEALFDRNSHHSSKDIIPSKRDSLVIKATNLIDETIYEPLTLEEICSELNISKYHFIRIFKGQVGITPYQYMLDIKMKLACEDLEYGEDILKVVDKYGFYDLSHFHKRFKKVFGVTPLEYQKYMI